MCPGEAHDTAQCEQISALLSRVGDKWTVLVVGSLGRGPMRFNALRRTVGDISQKMLSTTLRSLERDGFVTRTVTPTNAAAGRVRADRPRPRACWSRCRRWPTGRWPTPTGSRRRARAYAGAAAAAPATPLHAPRPSVCFSEAMSKPADNPADPFKKALAEATRAMAGEPELTVAFSVDPPGCSAGDDAAAAGDPAADPRRGAARARHRRRLRAAPALPRHATHRRYAPEGEMAVALFEAMETARCEAVGARAMPGTAGNIDAKIADEAPPPRLCRDHRPGPGAARPGGGLSRAPPRHRPARCRPGRRTSWTSGASFLDSHAGGTFAGLDAVLDDQQAFARFSRRVIEDLGYGDQLGDDPDAGDDDAEDEASDDARPRTSRTPAATPRTRASRTATPRTRASDQRSDPQDMQAALEAADDTELAEELDVEESEAPERRPPPPLVRGRPRLQGLRHPLRRGDRRRGSRRPGRARAAARLPRPAARAAEGRGRAPRQPAAAPAAGAAEPRLGLRPRGGHARRRPARPRRRQPDDAALLQDGARHRVPRHRGHAAARQLRLDARPADLDRRDLGRRARPHAGALPGQGRDPRLHHPRLEGRPEPRGLARGAPPAAARPAQRPPPHRLQVPPTRRGGAPGRTSG